MASCCSLLMTGGATAAGDCCDVTDVDLLLMLTDSLGDLNPVESLGEIGECCGEGTLLCPKPRRSASSLSVLALASISSKLTVFTTLTAPNLDNFPPVNGFAVPLLVVKADAALKSGTAVTVAVTGEPKGLCSTGFEASLNKSSSVELFPISGVSGITSTNGSSGFLQN